MAVSAVRVTVRATILRTDVPALCAHLADTLRDLPGGGVVVCDVDPAAENMVVVEALARLRLTARRHGWGLSITGVNPELRRLIGMLGLTATLPTDS